MHVIANIAEYFSLSQISQISQISIADIANIADIEKPIANIADINLYDWRSSDWKKPHCKYRRYCKHCRYGRYWKAHCKYRRYQLTWLKKFRLEETPLQILHADIADIENLIASYIIVLKSVDAQNVETLSLKCRIVAFSPVSAERWVFSTVWRSEGISGLVLGGASTDRTK